jgi:hypothetical protein
MAPVAKTKSFIANVHEVAVVDLGIARRGIKAVVQLG